MSLHILFFFILGVLGWIFAQPLWRPKHHKGIFFVTLIVLIMLPVLLSPIIPKQTTQDFFWTLASGIFFGDFLLDRWRKFKQFLTRPNQAKPPKSKT